MKANKFGADLLKSGRVGGHIYVDEKLFMWKPVKFLFFGAFTEDIVIPIEELEGYKKDGWYLYIGVRGSYDLLPFYTWKGSSIIESIQQYNSDFKMYASNEVR